MGEVKKLFKDFLEEKLFNDFSNRHKLFNSDFKGLRKEYFGINIQDREINDLKVYKTYFSKLPIEQVIELLQFDALKYLLPSYKSITSNYDPKAGGTGITFTLKKNFKSHSIKQGLYFLAHQNALESQPPLQLFEDFKKDFGKYPIVRNDFLNYFEFDATGKFQNKRTHYYSKDKELMQFIQERYQANFSDFTHELEIYQDQLQPKKIKINLLMDLKNFEQYYIKTSRGSILKDFILDNNWLKPLKAVVPGFYTHQNINSLYFLNLEEGVNQNIDTFKKLKSIVE